MAVGSLRKSHFRLTMAMLKGTLVELQSNLLKVIRCLALSIK